MTAPYTDTDLLDCATQVHEAMEQAFANEDEEDEHGVCPKRDKHYDKAIALLRELVDEAYRG